MRPMGFRDHYTQNLTIRSDALHLGRVTMEAIDRVMQLCIKILDLLSSK